MTEGAATNISPVLINLLIRYLNQQKELYGNEYFLEKSVAEQLVGILSSSPQTLEELYQEMKNCQRCELSRSRTHLVFGAGNPHAKLMLIGEAPGQEEDLRGEPFVGRAGMLLTKILQSINMKREDVYIANILKCRPPHNRDPLPHEVEKCEPYLKKQIEIIRPKVILALGRIAAQTLLKTTKSLKELRGKVHYYQGIKLVVTFHPAALLRNPQWKRPTWEDVQFLRRIYDEQVA